MEQEKLKPIVEAILMAAEKPMNISELLKMFNTEAEQPERTEIRDALKQLTDEYDGRGIELVEVASGFRLQVRQDYASWVNRLYDEKPPRYSRALLETLAIIAYRQPITRGEIEEIRGVSVSSNIVKTLMERGWVKIVGHRDVPGKPALIATTREFLDYFNLKKLSELPSLAEIKDFDQMNPDLFEGLDIKPEDIAANSAETVADAVTDVMESDAEILNETSDENVQENDAEEALLVTDDEASEESDDDNVIPFTG